MLIENVERGVGKYENKTNLRHGHGGGTKYWIHGVFIDTAEWEKVQRLAFPCGACDGKGQGCLITFRDGSSGFFSYVGILALLQHKGRIKSKQDAPCSACNGTGIDKEKLDKFLKGGKG